MFRRTFGLGESRQSFIRKANAHHVNFWELNWQLIVGIERHSAFALFTGSVCGRILSASEFRSDFDDIGLTRSQRLFLPPMQLALNPKVMALLGFVAPKEAMVLAAVAQPLQTSIFFPPLEAGPYRGTLDHADT